MTPVFLDPTPIRDPQHPDTPPARPAVLEHDGEHTLRLTFRAPDNLDLILFTFDSPKHYADQTSAAQDAPALYQALAQFADNIRQHTPLYIVADETSEPLTDEHGWTAVYRFLTDAATEANSQAQSTQASYTVQTTAGDIVHEALPDQGN